MATVLMEENKSERLIEKLQATWKELKARRKYADELRHLDEYTLHQLAADSHLSTFDLAEIAAAGPHGADEMPKMMQALNIDPMAVEFEDAEAFRAMQVECAKCANKNGCQADLKNASASEKYMGYCRNADSLNALRAQPDMLLS